MISYYSKSLYGIDTSSKILNWVDNNISDFSGYSGEQLLMEILGLFSDLFPEQITIEFENLVALVFLWIEGKTYVEIYNELYETLTISKIEKICSKTIAYHICFLIGNILDAVSDQDEKLTNRLSILQKQLKYGVPNKFQIFICENIFDERVIANQIDDLVGGNVFTDKELKQYIVARRNEILYILDDYPDYFEYKFRMYINMK